MVPFNSLFFFLFQWTVFHEFMAKEKEACLSKENIQKPSMRKWTAYCLKQNLLVKNCWGNLKQEQEGEQNIKSTEIQIEKVNDSTKVCLKLKIFSLHITNHLHCSCDAEILILFGLFSLVESTKYICWYYFQKWIV